MIIYTFYLTEYCGHHNDTVTDSHAQSQARIGVLVYRSVQNTKPQVHQNDLTKTNTTISLMQPSDVSMGCKVFKVPF